MNKTRLILATGIAALLQNTVMPSRAAVPDIFTWDGGDGSNPSFLEPTNWAANVAPNGNDSLHFAGVNNLAMTNFGSYAGYRIFFDPTAGAFTLGGTGTVTLFDFTATAASGGDYVIGSNAPKIENASLSTQTFNTSLALSNTAGNFAEINPVSGNLIFNSSVDLLSSGLQLRIFGNNGATVTFNGAITNSGGGSATLALNANSTVVLNAANTFTGDTFVNAGNLTFGVTGSVASSFLRLGDTSGAQNATLTIGADVAGGVTVNTPIVVRSGSSGTKTIAAGNTNGTNTLAGNISLDDNVTLNSGSGGTFAVTGATFDLKGRTLTARGIGETIISSVLSNSTGTGSLVKTDFGRLTLSGANTYTGTTTISNGTLAISSDANLGLTSAVIFGNGTLETSATFNLPVTRVISLTTFGGGFSPDALTTLTVDGAIGGVGDLNKAGTGTLILTNPANNYGGTTVADGTLALGASNVLPNNALVVSGGVLDLTTNNETVGSILLTGTGAINGTTGILTSQTIELQSGSASGILAGSNGVLKTGGGTATLTGANLFTGGIQVQGGNLAVGNDAALGPAANVVNLDGGGLFGAASTTVTHTVTIADNFGNNFGAAAGVILTLGGPITGIGAIGTLASVGTVALGSGPIDTIPNTFNGPITVSGGTLSLNKAPGTLATSSTSLTINFGTVVFGSGSNPSASNQLPPTTEVVVSGGMLNFSPGTGIGAASQTLKSLTIMGTGSMGTTVGALATVGDLNTITITDAFTVMSGTPTINSGTEFFTGPFTISGGTLLIGGNTPLRHTLFSPATVNLNGGIIQINAGSVAGAIRGEFSLNSDVIVGGLTATSINRGAGTTSEPMILLNSPTRVFNVADVNGSPTSDLVIGVNLDNGGIVKTGPGTLSLNKTGSPFTGDIAVQGGTLAFTGSGTADQTALGTGGKVITLTNNAHLRIATTDANPSNGTKVFVIGAGGGTFEVDTGRTFTLDDGTTLLSGPVVAGTAQLQGSATLTKIGPGTFVAGGAAGNFSATFTGNVNIFQGLLTQSNVNGLGTVGTLIVDSTLGAARLNLTFAANAIATNLVVQNGGTLSMTANENLPNTRTLAAAGTAPGRVRVDDGAAATPSGTAARTFILNGTLNGTSDLQVAGGTFATRGILSSGNIQSNISGTIFLDKNTTLENNPRFNGTTATGTGKTIGTAAIHFSPSFFSNSTADALLDLRDNGTAGNQTFAYGNIVDMSETGGTISVGTTAAGSATPSIGSRFVLGTLTLGDGNTITVNSANTNSLEFSGMTTLAGAANFAGNGDLFLSGGTTGGTDLTKIGTGILTIGASAGVPYSGSTFITGGGVVFNSAAAIGGSGPSIFMADATVFGAGFAGASQSNFINRTSPNPNALVFALAADTSANLNLTGYSAARLGSIGTATFGGVLTPDLTTYRLGGGAAGHVLILSANNALTGTSSLDVGTNGTFAGVVALAGSNNFTGSISLSGGELLRPQTNASLGNAANIITADGGGIQLASGAPFDVLAVRNVVIGPGGLILHTNGNDYTPSVAIGHGEAGGFTKAGNGVLNLGAASNYLGATTIAGGTLALDDVAKLGPTSGVTLGAGTLRFTGAASSALGKPVTLSGTGGVIQVSNATGKLTLNQGVSGGPAAGNLALTITGAGATELSVVSTFTGNILVDGGTLSVIGQAAGDPTFLGTGVKTVTLQNGATLRTTGASNFDPTAGTKALVIGAGTSFWNVPDAGVGVLLDADQFRGSGTLVKTGPGRVVFGSTQTNFTGNLTIAAGQVDIRSSTAALGSYNSLTLQGGTLRFQTNGTATPGDVNFSNYNPVVTGNAIINVDRDSANTANTIVLGTLGIDAHTLTITNANNYKLKANNVSLTGNATFEVAGAATNAFTVGGVISGAGFGFTKIGAQPMTLGLGPTDITPNTYTGVTVVSNGTLTLTKQPGLAGSGGPGGGAIVGDNNTGTSDITVSGTGILFLNDNEQIADTATLTLNAGGVFNLGGRTETLYSINFNGGSVVKGAGGVLNLVSAPGDIFVFDADALPATSATANIQYVGAATTGTIASLTLGPGAHVINVANGTAPDDLIISGVVDGAGQTFTKAGPGVLLLSSANTFGGAGVTVTSSGGSIAYTTEAALGDPANTIVVNNGGTVQPRGLATITRLPLIGTGGGGLDIPTGQTNTVSSGLANVPGQSGAFVKAGGGTLILDGTYSFDGGVTVTGGALRLQGGTGHGPIGIGPITVAGGTAELRNDVSNVYGNHVNVTTSGNLLFSRVGTTATNQTLTVGDLGQGGTGQLTLIGTAGYTLNVANVNLPGGLLYGNATGYITIGTSFLVVAPGGTVALGNGVSNVRIGAKQLDNSGTSLNATFDATSAASFTANVANFEVGVEPGGGGSNATTGTLKLPASASITATTQVMIGDSTNQGGTGVIQVGAGSTSFTAPKVQVGGRKGNGTLSVAAGGTLTINNGASRAQLIVGQNNVSTGVAGSGNFDLSGAGAARTLIANLQSVIVGEKTAGSASAGGNASGNWNLGDSATTNVSILNTSGIALLVGHHNPNNAAFTPSSAIAGTVTLNAGTLSIATTDNVLPTVRLGWSDGTYNGTNGGEPRGILNINGGTLTIANNGTGAAIDMTPTNALAGTSATQKATAALNISGGSVSVTGPITVGTATGPAVWSSTIALSGGTLDVNGGAIGAVTSFNFTGGTLQEVGSLARDLTQNGAASQFLVTGNNTAITGLYTLTAGTAIVDPLRTLAPSGGTVLGGGLLTINGGLTGSLTVNSGTVFGNGTLAGATFNGGILAPGNSAGHLNTGDLSLGPASSFAVELGGTTAGTGYDQVSVTGTLTLAGTLNASFINGFVPPLDTPFFLMLNDGTDLPVGTFAGLPEGAALNIAGNDFTITYVANGDGGTLGNDLAIITAPEPAGAMLLLGGLGAMLGLRPRRRS